MIHFLAAFLLSCAQDAAPGSGIINRPPPKPPAPRELPKTSDTPRTTGGGGGAASSGGSKPAPVVVDEDPTWRDTHRVELRNGNFIDGKYDEEASTSEIIIIKYSSTAEVAINIMDIARDKEGKPCIVKMTMRSIKDLPQTVATKPVDPGPGTDPRTGPIPGVEPTTGPDPSSFSKETKARVEQILSALVKEENKQAFVEMLAKSNGDCLVYAASLISQMNPDVATYVFSAFIKAKEARVLPELRRQLTIAKHPNTVSSIISYLGATKDSRASTVVGTFTTHSDSTVRYSALEALSNIGTRENIDAVALCVTDEDKQVRSQAQIVLIAMAKRLKSPRDAYAGLRTAMRKAKPEGLEMVAMALGLLGLPEGSSVLLELANSATATVRAAAIHGLGELKAKDALPRLHSMLVTEKEEELRGFVCDTVIKIGDQSSVPALINALRTESSKEIKGSINRALRNLTAENFPPEYEPWRKWLESRK